MTIQNILLTNIHLENFAGTELNTLSLAKELKRQGYNVETATMISGDPLLSYFRREEIPVFAMPEINEKHYDLIFANHFPALTYCLTTANIRADKIVYLSNSSVVSIEAPPAYINNLTYCLAIGNFLIPQFRRYGVEEEIIRLFPNYLTEDEISLQGNPGTALKKLAIISNHVPEVVYQTAEILRDRDITVDIYGVKDSYKLLSAQDLVGYDGVVSIGKSIYWALGIGIPAFCFDHFGGPGWITEENISIAYDHIFSGKGFDSESPSPEQLADQIVDGYVHGLSSINSCQEFIKSRCRLSANLESLISDINDQAIVSDPFMGFSKEILERKNQAFIDYYQFRNFLRLNQFQLGEENDRLKKEYNRLEKEYYQLGTVYDEMANSLGWKILTIGRKYFGKLYRIIRQAFRKEK